MQNVLVSILQIPISISIGIGLEAVHARASTYISPALAALRIGVK